MLTNKKGFSEITSFVLLFSLIAISSTIAYTFSKDIIDEKIAQIDLENANGFLKIIKTKTDEIKNFDEATFTTALNFKKGTYIFESDKIYYQSIISYIGNDYCLSDICYQNYAGSEKLYISLNDSYQLKNNFSLLPGSYILTFKNLKNVTQIEIKIS